MVEAANRPIVIPITAAPGVRAAVLLAFTILLLVGCTAAPQLGVRGVEVTDRTDEATVLNFLLEIANPHDEPVELHQFDYTLSVDGSRVYSGRSAAQATVGPLLTSQLEIPAVVRHDAGSMAGASYTISGRLTYTAPGFFAQAMLDLGLPRPSISFSGTGQLGEPAVPAGAARAD